MQESETLTHNVGAADRAASIAAGSLLVTRGIQKRSARSVFGAVLGAGLIYRGISGQSSLYHALNIDTAKKKKHGAEIDENAPEFRRSITIAKSSEELCDLWSEPRILSQVMGHFADVTPKPNGSAGVLHWSARGPFGQAVEWDTQQTREQGGRGIIWQSLPGAEFPSRGSVSFRPGPDGVGTEVTLHLQFEPPLGEVGARVMRGLRKFPRSIAGQALRRFKSLVETGEIPTLATNPSGRGTLDTF